MTIELVYYWGYLNVELLYHVKYSSKVGSL